MLYLASSFETYDSCVLGLGMRSENVTLRKHEDKLLCSVNKEIRLYSNVHCMSVGKIM